MTKTEKLKVDHVVFVVFGSIHDKVCLNSW